MPIFRITGKAPLKGRVRISGHKNAALKLIAASLISDQNVILHNVPDIGDMQTMRRILTSMGVKIKIEGETWEISAKNLNTSTIPEKWGKKLRASLVCVGPLLARAGVAVFPHPGGCVIGKRSITPHLDAFELLGGKISLEEGTYTITAKKLKGTEIYLQEKSVTGTENIIMAAVRAHGTTTLFNAAQELHIVNLCSLLRNMGFRIEGDGTSTITIYGDPKLQTQPAEIAVIPDEIEMGTFAVAAAVTKGKVTMENVGTKHQLLPILAKLDAFNVVYRYDEKRRELTILPSPRLQAANVQTNPWPGFPADLQSPFTVLATQAKGTSLIHDWMYEGRLYFVDLLQKMGAEITICDPHRALVTGPVNLNRTTVTSPDLRAGAALVIAALASDGESIIEHAELIDRGYVRFDDKLRALGANIVRE